VRLLGFVLLFAAAGCTTFDGQVISVNEDDETVAVSDSYSFAMRIVSVLEKLPEQHVDNTGESPEKDTALFSGLDHTLRVEIYEPGESGQKIMRGPGRQAQTRSTGYVRRFVRARVRNDVTEVIWQAGWGKRTGIRELRGTSAALAEAIRGMSPYVPASQLGKVGR